MITFDPVYVGDNTFQMQELSFEGTVANSRW